MISRADLDGGSSYSYITAMECKLIISMPYKTTKYHYLALSCHVWIYPFFLVISLFLV